jgi:hypothetical protein
MLEIGYPDRHALPRITPSKTHQPCRALPPARVGLFFGATSPFTRALLKAGSPPFADLIAAWTTYALASRLRTSWMEASARPGFLGRRPRARASWQNLTCMIPVSLRLG